MKLGRRKKAIQQIRSMCMNEKYHTLNQLIEPFGFSYVASQNIFTSKVNAWQRDFGYCTLYVSYFPAFLYVMFGDPWNITESLIPPVPPKIILKNRLRKDGCRPMQKEIISS